VPHYDPESQVEEGEWPMYDNAGNGPPSTCADGDMGHLPVTS
jgi:hypothetical protein